MDLEEQRWRIIGQSNKKDYVLCICVCGTKRDVNKYHLRNSATRSCGCLRNDKTVQRNTKHGLTKRNNKKHPTYSVWSSMLTRCGNPKSVSYKYYGGRGISVCDEWKNSYMSFRSWALLFGYKNGLQLDRKDNDKGYYPKNCRWVTPKENSANRRKAVRRKLSEYWSE